ncbi:TIGR02117 family protein [Hymenobacter sp. GOD-10R]|uniref:TIGR02117 family protein n=1 Tax=Hymenobacter sp. GOD-10R TaxID=3093922 RepID=UPI002D76ACEA|nr:TIGR02117 family protein [Hymenobacter sp. GOD-10R]WRQ26552.1 TIGR02117 family protein [Hymenobacter sp. GOD-10R]
MAALAALLLFFVTGTLVPVNKQFRQTPGGVPIFVVSNGFHSDVVVPLREPRTQTDWLQKLGQPTWANQFARYQFVAFGWGSEGFFLDSYGGHFPRLSTTLRAAVPGRSLMHVGFYPAAPAVGARVIPLFISEAQYQKLVERITHSFQPDSAGHFSLRNSAGYTPHDFFFRANGHYHLLRTCNDWTNRTLGRAGIRAAWKAPLAASVLYQVRKAE